MSANVKARLMAALTGIHERPLDYPQWGLTDALLREFTARERQYANDAVQQEGGADPDQILFRAMLMQRCITDPATGRPYGDGRIGPDGQAMIDPRTRTPIFTVEEIQEIADSRAFLFTHIWDDLLELAAAGPLAMFPGGVAADGRERDAGTGAEAPGDGLGEHAGEGIGDVDSGNASAHEPESGNGDTAGGTAG